MITMKLVYLRIQEVFTQSLNLQKIGIFPSYHYLVENLNTGSTLKYLFWILPPSGPLNKETQFNDGYYHSKFNMHHKMSKLFSSKHVCNVITYIILFPQYTKYKNYLIILKIIFTKFIITYLLRTSHRVKASSIFLQMSLWAPLE